jgi:hypothetical protein
MCRVKHVVAVSTKSVTGCPFLNGFASEFSCGDLHYRLQGLLNFDVIHSTSALKYIRDLKFTRE